MIKVRIFKYDGTQEEQERIAAEQLTNGYVLTHISNITEGNFLGFMKDGTVPEPKTSIEEKIELLKQDITQNNLTTLDIQLALYEEFLTLRDEVAELKNA